MILILIYDVCAVGGSAVEEGAGYHVHPIAARILTRVSRLGQPSPTSLRRRWIGARLILDG